jgi:hypothetical protein
MGSGIAQAATVGCRSDGGYERCETNTSSGVIGAIAAVAALAAGDDDNDRGSSGSAARREENAIALCTDYADQIVKDAGGRGARLDQVKRPRRDGDKWQVEAYMEARWQWWWIPRSRRK